MKKILFGLILFVFTTLNINGQEKILSQADQFSSKSGILIEKEFIDIGRVRTLEVKVLKIKDLNSGSKISSLRFELTTSGAYTNDTHISSLDADEVDGLIKSITNIQNNVITTLPSNYTECIYRSKTGMEFGAFFSKSDVKWTLFVKVDKYSNKSIFIMKNDEITTLLNLVSKSKEFLN